MFHWLFSERVNDEKCKETDGEQHGNQTEVDTDSEPESQKAGPPLTNPHKAPVKDRGVPAKLTY